MKPDRGASKMTAAPALTLETYFSPEAEWYYIGSTQYKRFKACEARAMAVLRGEWQEETSTALLVGSYVDAYFSGTLPLFKAQHPEIFTRQGALKSEYQHAEYIIARIERDPVFIEALSGESQRIMTGEIEGVPVKIKVDSLLPDRIVDLKIMHDLADRYNAEDFTWEPFWKAWGYDIQGAIYREIVRQNTGRTIPFGLAVATKEKPEPDILLGEIPQAALDTALEEVLSDIAYFDAIKKGFAEPARCEKCPYCRATKKLTGWVVL